LNRFDVIDPTLVLTAFAARLLFKLDVVTNGRSLGRFYNK